jgi:hypothetical protein
LLLGGFFDFEDVAALVDAALGAGAVGELLLVAVGALGDADGGKEVVRAAEGSAALGVTPFRIRHCKFLSCRDPVCSDIGAANYAAIR